MAAAAAAAGKFLRYLVLTLMRRSRVWVPPTEVVEEGLVVLARMRDMRGGRILQEGRRVAFRSRNNGAQ